jgi:DNA-binding MurR/RpiR family transcriptional regulator
MTVLSTCHALNNVLDGTIQTVNSTLQKIESAAVGSSPALACIGRWIAASPIQTLSLSAEELARAAGASIAAVNRFSLAAGFKGYADLKSALGQELQSATAPLRKLEASGRSKRPKDQLQSEDILLAGRDVKVPPVAERLLKADQVFILGLGLSSYIGAYAAHALTPYVPRAFAIAGPGGTEAAARRLSTIGKADVFIALTLPRYSRDTVHMAAFAKRRGAYIVAITDSVDAPIAREADVVLLAPVNHPTLSSSAMGMLAVVEGLVSCAMERNPNAEPLAREVSDLMLSHLL